MSIPVPLRLQVRSNGTVQGYVEALDFRGASVAVSGPIAYISGLGGTGGGGGDASSLGGLPASYYAANSNLTKLSAQVQSLSSSVSSISYQLGAATARSNWWNMGGVYVAAGPPVDPIQYSQWVAGSTGHWAWIRTP